MSVIFLLIPLSVMIAAGFLGAFIWAVRSGQYEDTCTPSMRLLLHEEGPKPPTRQHPAKPAASTTRQQSPVSALGSQRKTNP